LFFLFGGPPRAFAQDMPLTQVLLPGEPWRLVAKGPRPLGDLATGPKGEVVVLEAEGRRAYRVAGGKLAPWATLSAGSQGPCFGPDGKLYACQPFLRRVVTVGLRGKEEVFARDADFDGLAALVVTRGGHVYCAAPQRDAIYLLVPGRSKRLVARWPSTARALALWPDGGTLVAGERIGSWLVAFRVDTDGGLSAQERYYPLRERPGWGVGATSLALDRASRLYAATTEGVQVFDPTGRLSGVLLSPERAPVTAVAFGGPALEQLYVVCGGNLYARKVRANELPKGKRPGK
jgi:sugar lactone lactonase YvrE